MREGAALTMDGIAAMVGELLAALALEDVVLVGNDTGGALAQVVATSTPERLGALVLTSCDAFEHFPPPILKPFIAAAKAGPAYDPAIQPLRTRFGRKRGLGALAHADIDKLVSEWVEPALTDRRVRGDLRRGASRHRSTGRRRSTLRRGCRDSPSRRWSPGPPTTSSSRSRMAGGWPKPYPIVGSKRSKTRERSR
jgi:pimeloyl-ACP methyl ester carboxylesterase